MADNTKTALVVDSDYFFVEFLAELLAGMGYAVTKAYDGKEGMAKLEQADYDMIFIDMVMPKVDGWQLIGYIQLKYPARRFPVIALSATIIEQLGHLDQIAADYFIAKGPIAKMRDQLVGFVQRIENRQPLPETSANVLTMENLFPRRESVQLIENLRFQQAIVESIGMGVIVVDNDGRVLTANTRALSILNRPAIEVLNRGLPTLFPETQRRAVLDSLRAAARQDPEGPCNLNVVIDSQVVRLIITLLKVGGRSLGWVAALETTGFEIEK